MDRRTLLVGGAGGAVGSIFVAGGVATAAERLLGWGNSADHVVRILNRRESSQRVTVECGSDGGSTAYGPRNVESGDVWTVTQLESNRTVTIEVDVEGSSSWQATHDVPTVDGERSSGVDIRLLPDGDVEQRIWAED